MGRTALAIHGSLVMLVIGFVWRLVAGDPTVPAGAPVIAAVVGGPTTLRRVERDAPRPRVLPSRRAVDAAPAPLQVEGAAPARAALPAGTPSPDDPAFDALLVELLDDLRDDDERFNAQRSMRRLRGLLAVEDGRPRVAEALTAALDSADMQQRYFAATALMNGHRDGRLSDPSERLVAVALDMMCEGRLDGAPWGIRELRRCLEAPQDKAIRFLTVHADRARGRLLRLLDRTSDEEARFLAAYVLATQGRAEDTDRLAPALVNRLVDNDIDGDAVMAMNGLMALDHGRVDWWLQLVDRADEQFVRSKRLLLVALRNGGEVPREVLKRDNVVTRRVLNPVQGWTFRGYD